MLEEVGHDCTECTVEFRPKFCGRHEINWDGIDGGSLCFVEDEPVFPAFLDKVVLRG